MTKIVVTQEAPKVFLIGKTVGVPEGMQAFLDYRQARWGRGDMRLPESIIEFGGSVCYDSFHNPGNKSTESYVQGSIVSHKHGSVLEHPWLSFAVASVPRNVQLETVRHGDGTAFSWRSTRFCDTWLEIVVPPAYRGDDADTTWFRETYLETSLQAVDTYLRLVSRSDSLSLSDQQTLNRKRKREAAANVLPGGLGSDGVVSMNARALRWIVECRTDEHANASIRELAHGIYEEAKDVLPAVLADAEEVPVSMGPPEVRFEHSKV